MEKVIRRQLGADAVDIDTRASTCSFAYEDSVWIPFEDMQDAAADANYNMIGLIFTAQGKVVEAYCDTCGSDELFLELPGTEQRLELTKDHPLGEVMLRAQVQGWNDENDHVQLLVIE